MSIVAYLILLLYSISSIGLSVCIHQCHKEDNNNLTLAIYRVSIDDLLKRCKCNESQEVETPGCYTGIRIGLPMGQKQISGQCCSNSSVSLSSSNEYLIRNSIDISKIIIIYVIQYSNQNKIHTIDYYYRLAKRSNLLTTSHIASIIKSNQKTTSL